MDIIHAFIIIVVAALIHASFQLSVSVLTLLSGHAIGSKKSHQRLVRLSTSFILGAGIMTVLLLSFSSLVFLSLLNSAAIPMLVWVVACGLLIGLGVAVWSFYYRFERGTTLWLPRSIARHLSDRTKATKRGAEAFGLGLTSVMAELLFIIAPIIVSSLVIIQLEPAMQLLGVAAYTIISLLSLLIVAGMIGSGHKLSLIQKWRESNKRFLQFSAGSALLILGFYIYVDQVIATTVLAQAGGF